MKNKKRFLVTAFALGMIFSSVNVIYAADGTETQQVCDQSTNQDEAASKQAEEVQKENDFQKEQEKIAKQEALSGEEQDLCMSSQDYISEEEAKMATSGIQSGTQQALAENLKYPLSAWKNTTATYQRYDFYDAKPYAVQLVEMYTGEKANEIVEAENPFNETPNSNQQWILMKYKIQNNGTELLDASDIIYYTHFYNSSGAKMAVSDTATFCGDRRGMGVFDLDLYGGACGYCWIGILVPTADGMPYLEISNGYDTINNKAMISWLNTDPNYTHTITEQTGTAVSAYQETCFYKQADGTLKCYSSDGSMIKNDFKCDGVSTYYFQNDGSDMMGRLTYHPDGTHVIYFDEKGHEVFSDFTHVVKSISGDAVDDFCFFDVHGYMYTDVMTYDSYGYTDRKSVV